MHGGFVPRFFQRFYVRGALLPLRGLEEKERIMRNIRGILLGFFGAGTILGVFGHHATYPLWIDPVGLIILCAVTELLLVREEGRR